MKVSKYTFTFKTNDEYYLYNSLSNALIEIDKESFLTIDNCLNNNNDIIADDFDTDLFHELKKQGFITENDIDDFLLYKSVIMRQRNENSSMHLTIAPTMVKCMLERCDLMVAIAALYLRKSSLSLSVTILFVFNISNNSESEIELSKSSFLPMYPDNMS